MSNLQHLALFMFLIFLPAGRSLFNKLDSSCRPRCLTQSSLNPTSTNTLLISFCENNLKKKATFLCHFSQSNCPGMHKYFRETSLHKFCPPFERGVFSIRCVKWFHLF